MFWKCFWDQYYSFFSLLSFFSLQSSCEFVGVFGLAGLIRFSSVFLSCCSSLSHHSRHLLLLHSIFSEVSYLRRFLFFFLHCHCCCSSSSPSSSICLFRSLSSMLKAFLKYLLVIDSLHIHGPFVRRPILLHWGSPVVSVYSPYNTKFFILNQENYCRKLFKLSMRKTQIPGILDISLNYHGKLYHI